MTRPDSMANDLHLAEDLRSELNAGIFQELLEFFPDIIHSVDRDGVILSTNHKASELLGYKVDELVGKNVFDIYPEEIAREVKKGFAQLKRRGVIERVESKLKARDGSIIDVEIRSLAVYDKDGEFVKTFSIIRDIRELNELKNRVIQQSKLAAIGELAAGIMHDIRNPLSVITVYNNNILPKALNNNDIAAARKAQDRMEKAVRRIARLSDHLRRFSRNEVEEPEKFTLSSLLEDCRLMVESRLKSASAELVLQLEDPDLELVGRPNQLEQVFINLLSNACDAVLDQDQRRISVSSHRQGDFICIEVSDTGPGIDEKNQELIFESFFTTKEKDSGTGLGLAICKGIIFDQKGTITVRSKKGEGATFIVRLPVDINAVDLNEDED